VPPSVEVLLVWSVLVLAVIAVRIIATISPFTSAKWVSVFDVQTAIATSRLPYFRFQLQRYRVPQESQFTANYAKPDGIHAVLHLPHYQAHTIMGQASIRHSPDNREHHALTVVVIQPHQLCTYRLVHKTSADGALLQVLPGVESLCVNLSIIAYIQIKPAYGLTSVIHLSRSGFPPVSIPETSAMALTSKPEVMPS